MNKPNRKILLIIPARNEALSLPVVLKAVPVEVTKILVVDNGSTDKTAAVAAANGAEVVAEGFPGYGSACLAGIASVSADPPDIVAFADADGSDGVANLPALLDPVLAGRAELVLAQRVPVSRNSLSLQQRCGNRLAVMLIRLFWGYPYHDLGPMRAVRWDALMSLGMKDRTWGWTVEMQIKAVVQKLRIMEVPLPYNERIAGKSKISRTLTGVAKASAKILTVIAREFCIERLAGLRLATGKVKARRYLPGKRESINE